MFVTTYVGTATQTTYLLSELSVHATKLGLVAVVGIRVLKHRRGRASRRIGQLARLRLDVNTHGVYHLASLPRGAD